MVQVDENMKEAVEAQFKSIYTNKCEAKDLASRNTEMFKALSETLNMKKSEVRMAFKQWESQFADDADSLENVTSLLEILGVGNE